MIASSCKPVFELTRGDIVECIHHGAVAVVDAYGTLVAWYGDPDTVAFLRSTAKPFQALPFFEHGGQALYHLTQAESAIICASHSGTDQQVAVVQSLQAKTGVSEAELLCGIQEPSHKPTADALREREEQLTSNRHNCSGKHTAMLAYIRAKRRAGNQLPADLEYINPAHPIQLEIIQTFAEMCRLPVEQVEVGIDGCSAPNFAVPLRNAALGYARLCDPEAGQVLPPERAAACRRIASAMMECPDMVGGPGRFDTRLMEICRGRMLSKGGAEGYQGVGLMPGALGPGSPAMGIALKIADGDARNKARAAVTLEVLRQLGALSAAELEALSDFGPHFPLLNWRKILVGKAYPVVELSRAA